MSRAWGFWVNQLAAVYGIPDGLRVRMLRAAGISIGSRTVISGGCFFGSPLIALGDDVYVGPRCFFDGSGSVRIGDRVTMAFNVVVVTATHEVGPSARRAATVLPEPVVVGEGVWLGANVMILPGVTVGPGSVVSAASVVTRDTGADVLVRGAPAVRVRGLP